MVALRKESVDRNSAVSDSLPALMLSLSARRAWIEITDYAAETLNFTVALRKESVDRNQGVHYDNYNLHVALRKESVDRNRDEHEHRTNIIVALRKESVDRNTNLACQVCVFCRRSPQGERG